MSTTFARFRSMYQTMPRDFLDYLFIDEVEQAVVEALYQDGLDIKNTNR